MNENVIIKTPKRRRWIARLLVSALCILLASSLLFVGVIADVVVLSPSSSFTVFPGVATSQICIIDYDVFAFCGSEIIYLYRDDFLLGSYSFSSVPGFVSSGEVAHSLYFDSVRSSLYCLQYCDHTLRIVKFIYSEFSFTSSSFASYSIWDFEYSGKGHLPFVAYDGHLYGFLYGSGYRAFAFFHFFNGDIDVGPTITRSSVGRNILFRSGSLYLNGYCYFPSLGVVTDTSGDIVSEILSYPFFSVDGMACYANNNFIYSVDPLTGISETVFEITGFSSSGFILGYSSGSVLTLFNYFSGATLSNKYSVAVFPDAIVPSESSDETTTEPPPESSEDSSEPSSALTNVWKVDRGFKESLAGSIDLSGATRIRAFLGVFTSSGSSFASDRAVPLTIEVYRNGLDSPDVYTFDFFAYGWGATSNGFPNSYDSYTFPDVVGLYYDIPIPADGEGLLFPTFAPYGSIYVNFSDSVFPDDIQRVTFNLYNSQGYLDVNFTSSSSTSFTIYNDDLTKGKTYTFDSGTFNYKCFFDLDGEYSETEWFSPQFGSSIKYSAEDVLESGLYAIYSFNDDSIEYPWGNGEWSEAISNANSRLDQVSLDYEILESKANEAYGQFSFNSMTGQDFIGAVSNFETIKDSSGGSYILDYFFGMWNVHPFASSMIAIVGTLAIVGFIIRKL